jgi:GT2 family glycosyltransferase
MTTHRNAAVICTKDRPKLVTDLLNNLAAQSLLPDLVLVVNGGTTSLESVTTNSSPKKFQVEVVDTKPGLPKQRNIALRKLTNVSEYVHFLDDDVYLEPDYLLQIVKTFDSDSAIAGATGDITNAHPPPSHLLQRFFLLKSNSGGVVLPSGVNIGLPGQSVPKRIMWLPGCAMSYRIKALTGLEFDESRTGYALGEDVDFSARVGLENQLVYVPTARLEHRFEPRARVDSAALATDDVMSRWKLAESLPFVNKPAVAFSTIAHAISYYLTSFSANNAWRRKAATLKLQQLTKLVLTKP